MGNIFDEEKLYPYEGPIKKHFEEHFDRVFIAFLPFFQLDRAETDKSNLKKAKLLSNEEALSARRMNIFTETNNPKLFSNSWLYSIAFYDT